MHSESMLLHISVSVSDVFALFTHPEDMRAVFLVGNTTDDRA